MIIDFNGIKYKNCPRCGGNWDIVEFGYSLPDFKCEDCLMHAWTIVSSHVNDDEYYNYLFRLCLNSDNFSYEIVWLSDKCSVYSGRKWIGHFPLFPFTITVEKLKTYIIFS